MLRVTVGGDGEERELARLEVDFRAAAVGGRIIVAVSSELSFDFLAQEGIRVCLTPTPRTFPIPGRGGAARTSWWCATRRSTVSARPRRRRSSSG